MPSVMEGMPSGAVVEAARKAKKLFKLSTASARAIQYCRDIWKALAIEDPCIINGGSQIINPKTEEIIWEQCLPEGAIEEVLKRSKGYTGTFGLNGVFLNIKNDFKKVPKRSNLMVALGVKKENTQSLVQTLSNIPDVAVHILPSWTPGEYWDIHVIHKLATKKHAIEKLIEILRVKKEEVIGVGDGNNDMPLFESVGYKVAMGNSVETLKKAADYVTDSIENEGFAKFIDKILLDNS